MARHKRLIGELRADGHDTTSAEALLSTLIATQHIFEDHLRMILKENGLRNCDSASMKPVPFRPSHDIYEPRSEKFARICACDVRGMDDNSRRKRNLADLAEAARN